MGNSGVRAFRRWALPAAVLAAFLSSPLTVGPSVAQEKKSGKAPPAARPDGSKKGGAAKGGASKATPKKPGATAGAGESDAPKPAAPKPDAANAADPSAGPAAPAAAAPNDKLIVPFVTDDTVAVARLDLNRIDHRALERFIGRVFDEEARAAGSADAGPSATERAETAGALKKFEDALAAFQAANARHLYVMLEREDLNKDAPKPMFVVPNVAEGDFPKLASAMMRLRRDRQLKQATAGAGGVQETESQYMRVSKQIMLAQVKRGTIPERRDLLAALAAGGDAPLRIAVVPGEAARQQIEHMLPPLPGGADAKLLTRGVRWATLSFTQKPGMGLSLTARAADEANAKALVALTGEMLGKASGVAPEAVGQLVKRDGETLTLTTGEAPVLQGVVAGRRMAGMIAAQQKKAQPPAAPEGDGFD